MNFQLMKTDKWKRANLDAFEAIGKKQLAENMKFTDIFRMISGKMSYSELSEVAPQYRELTIRLHKSHLVPHVQYGHLHSPLREGPPCQTV